MALEITGVSHEKWWIFPYLCKVYHLMHSHQKNEENDFSKISEAFSSHCFPEGLVKAVFFFTAKWQLRRIPIGVCHVCLYIIDILCINKAIWLSVVTKMGDAKQTLTISRAYDISHQFLMREIIIDHGKS